MTHRVQKNPILKFSKRPVDGDLRRVQVEPLWPLLGGSRLLAFLRHAVFTNLEAARTLSVWGAYPSVQPLAFLPPWSGVELGSTAHSFNPNTCRIQREGLGVQGCS